MRTGNSIASRLTSRSATHGPDDDRGFGQFSIPASSWPPPSAPGLPTISAATMAELAFQRFGGRIRQRPRGELERLSLLQCRFHAFLSTKPWPPATACWLLLRCRSGANRGLAQWIWTSRRRRTRIRAACTPATPTTSVGWKTLSTSGRYRTPSSLGPLVVVPPAAERDVSYVADSEGWIVNAWTIVKPRPRHRIGSMTAHTSQARSRPIPTTPQLVSPGRLLRRTRYSHPRMPSRLPIVPTHSTQSPRQTSP